MSLADRGADAPDASTPARDPHSAMVTAALGGDAAAWRRLVRRYELMLRNIGRQYRLAAADIDDAMQGTWVRLIRVPAAIRTPAALGGWLATTMRRECWQILQAPTLEVLVAEAPAADREPAPDALADVLAAERGDAMRQALRTLPERHRELMALLTVEPPLSYADISARLAIPIGSIGPIRARSLARLRRDPGLRRLCN
jgi:RNA polymerase sigma factor (sigma-70 family)